MIKIKEKSLVDLTLECVSGDGEIITASGKWFNVFNPDPEEVDIEDIAHALSNQCRFTGHTKDFYSVAQHSVLVSRYLARKGSTKKTILKGLLHDASEAYLSDIARPIKKHPEFGPFYLKVEEGLTDAIMEAFDLTKEIPDKVHEADNVLLRTEARDLMPNSFPVYPGETLDQMIVPWSPNMSFIDFLDDFERLY